MTAPLVVTIPVLTRSEANMREHHYARAHRRKAQRTAVALVLRGPLRASGIRPPCRVHLTRIAPRKLDSDNLQGALKAVRDAVADLLGVDDGGDDVAWSYEQRPAAPKAYAVEIAIRSGEATP